MAWTRLEDSLPLQWLPGSMEDSFQMPRPHLTISHSECLIITGTCGTLVLLRAPFSSGIMMHEIVWARGKSTEELELHCSLSHMSNAHKLTK